MIAASEGRIARRFAALRGEARGGFIPFVTAGDPDADRSMAVLNGLARSGADLIEIGVPFSDPMADGPAIQAASKRALDAGQTLAKTLEMVATVRRSDTTTPIILMGYYNPIYIYGAERFARDAVAAGVDGTIIVDLPPEEDAEFAEPAMAVGLDLVRLVAPTTGEARLQAIAARARGFLYIVSITGITGTRSATDDAIRTAVSRIRAVTDLPVAVGFGIREPQQAAAVARVADAAVVGSALVERMAAGKGDGVVAQALDFAASIAIAVRKTDDVRSEHAPN